jgi:AraC-like DNA-binding protein
VASRLPDFFCGIPYISNYQALEATTAILAKYVFDGGNFEIGRIELNIDPPDYDAQILSERRSALALAYIEERYRNEEELMDAIAHGDLTRALLSVSGFNKFRIEPIIADAFRSAKHFSITLSTLARKAAQRGGVHPAHIDSVSSYFTLKIDAARDWDALKGICSEMLHKYCLLVQERALLGYSRPVQRALNYIEFHYTEPISLETLADVAAINPCNLSAQFKKETGVSVVEYINQNRIRRAQTLLLTTDFPISKIAEAVGIADNNYFTRIFKRLNGTTPKEYRLRHV